MGEIQPFVPSDSLDTFEEQMLADMSSMFVSATSGGELGDHRVGGPEDIVPYTAATPEQAQARPETPFGVSIARKLAKLGREALANETVIITTSNKGTLDMETGNTDSVTTVDD